MPEKPTNADTPDEIAARVSRDELLTIHFAAKAGRLIAESPSDLCTWPRPLVLVTV